MTGIAVSNAPNTSPTRSRVRPSTPLTPMPTDAAKFDSPSDAATSSSATMPATVPALGLGHPGGMHKTTSRRDQGRECHR